MKQSVSVVAVFQGLAKLGFEQLLHQDFCGSQAQFACLMSADSYSSEGYLASVAGHQVDPESSSYSPPLCFCSSCAMNRCDSSLRAAYQSSRASSWAHGSYSEANFAAFHPYRRRSHPWIAARPCVQQLASARSDRMSVWVRLALGLEPLSHLQGRLRNDQGCESTLLWVPFCRDLPYHRLWMVAWAWSTRIGRIPATKCHSSCRRADHAIPQD